MEKPLCGTGNHKPNSSEHRGSSRKPAGRSGSHSPGSGAAGAGGSRGSAQGNSSSLQPQTPQAQTPQAYRRRQLEGVLSKYTNLIQGWQNRYFLVDSELGQLQYFINEQGKSQKPRGSLPLIGASVTASDEAPHMFIVNSVNGELYKLRAGDAKEQQFWINHLQACARRYSDSSATVRKLKGSDEHLCVDRAGGGQEVTGYSSSGRTRSFSLLPHLTPSSSPSSQRHPGHAASPSNIVTITHHKSPAAARRAKIQYPGRLLEVKEVMSQAEGQQKNLVKSIDSLPTKGPLSCLDQDLLLLKATSAATLSCLGECLNILQRTQSSSEGPRASQHNHGARSVPSTRVQPQQQGPAGATQLGLLSLPDGSHQRKHLWEMLLISSYVLVSRHICSSVFLPVMELCSPEPPPLLKVCQKKTTLVPQVLNRRHACARSNKVLLIETKSA